MRIKVNVNPGYPIFRLFGLIFAAAGVYFLLCGFGNFKEQLDQRDWVETSGVITSVSERRVSSGARRSHSRIVYDMTYAYTVDGETYTGELLRRGVSKAVGTEFPLKYDPDRPGDSTDVLAPDVGTLAVNTVASLAYIAIPLLLTGWGKKLWNRIRKGG